MTTLTWQASEPAATMVIEGVGAFLPSSGSRSVPVAGGTAFSGRATNACGALRDRFSVRAVHR